MSLFRKKPEEQDKGLIEVPDVSHLPDGHPLKTIMEGLVQRAKDEGFEVNALGEAEYRDKCESEGLPVPPARGEKKGKAKINTANLEALSSTVTQLRRLKQLYDTYNRPDPLPKKGDMVQWRSGLMNHKIPQYGEPVVVMEVLDPPIFDDEGPSSPYFKEPITLKVGWIDPEQGNFYMFGVDGSRFEKFDG